MEDLIIQQRKPLTAAEIKAQVQLIQEIMSAVMIKDTHYGTIPGTPKPTLYKPGSEKILATFHIAAYPKEVEDLSGPDEIRYRVKVHGIVTGESGEILVGVGIGECSSEEEKYKWRKPVCEDEFIESPEDRRREVWKKIDGKPAKVKQIRTHPSDVANTILKMAKKRAQIDMTLTATAASDVFDQDLEDIPEEVRDGMSNGSKPPIKEPQKKQAPKEEPPKHPVARTQISEVKVKDGKKQDGTPYTVYRIYGTLKGNETSFSTFSKTDGELAMKERGTGMMVDIEYQTEEKDGKTYYKALSVKRAEREPGEESDIPF